MPKLQYFEHHKHTERGQTLKTGKWKFFHFFQKIFLFAEYQSFTHSVSRARAFTSKKRQKPPSPMSRQSKNNLENRKGPLKIPS